MLLAKFIAASCIKSMYFDELLIIDQENTETNREKSRKGQKADESQRNELCEKWAAPGHYVMRM